MAEGPLPQPDETDSSVVATRWLHVGAVLRAEGHTWIGDEPRWLGGDGSGPSPFAQLAGALAHCTISTLAARSELEGIPLAGCRVTVSPLVRLEGVGMLDDPGMSPRLADEANINVRVGRLVRAIGVGGDLSESQLERLLEIAEACPVSQSLVGAIPIRTSITRL